MLVYSAAMVVTAPIWVRTCRHLPAYRLVRLSLRVDLRQRFRALGRGRQETYCLGGLILEDCWDEPEKCSAERNTERIQWPARSNVRLRVGINNK